MSNNEEYIKISFDDLLLVYYKKFNKTFPLTYMRNCDNTTLKQKIIDCINKERKFDINDEKFNIEKQSDTIDYAQIINLIKESMSAVNYDYKKMIKETKNIVDLRKNGKIFKFEEHIEAIILSQLSNHRWGDVTIKENKQQIRNIFKEYDKEYLKQINANVLAKQLIDMNCGNASIYRQMESLSYNITILEKIEKDYGSLDDFVSSDNTNTLANMLYDGRYKMKQIGKAFALDYFKKVGINTCKSDIQINRIFGSNRLALVNKANATAIQTMGLIKEIAKVNNMQELEVDSLLCQFCLPRGANICTADPNCSKCKLKNKCNYNN